MAIILRVLISISGITIGAIISNSIFWLLDKRKEKKSLPSRKERASVMKRNSELYQELTKKEKEV